MLNFIKLIIWEHNLSFGFNTWTFSLLLLLYKVHLSIIIFRHQFCDIVFMNYLLPRDHSSIFHLYHFCALLGSIKKCVWLVHTFLLVVFIFSFISFSSSVLHPLYPHNLKLHNWGST